MAILIDARAAIAIAFVNTAQVERTWFAWVASTIRASYQDREGFQCLVVDAEISSSSVVTG
jgi:hypothetical protein